ncbi:class I SAM-dependent RNA methyltransferase [Lachnospiraceae bacterium ZAX-1]
MKKGQVCVGIVEKVDFPNKGIVYLEDGSVVVVKNTIPGQKISFSIHKVRKGRGEGRVLELLEKSPLELTKIPCIHFEKCGGCTFLNLSYEAQLKLKEQQVLELLKPVCELVCDLEDGIWEGIKESPNQFEYRNKMEFSFGDEYKEGPLSLGMHKRGSFYDIVTVSGCKIVDEDYNHILQCVVAYFREHDVSYCHKLRHQGYLRHLMVRKGAKTGEILIDLVTTSQLSSMSAMRSGNLETDRLECGDKPIGEVELLEGFKRQLQQLALNGNIVGILHTYNDSVADIVKNDKTEILFGQDFFYEEILGLKFKISPFSFFQTNSFGAEILYETVREYVADAGNGKIVYDLYSGTGTIAQMLAPVARKVIGVEIIEEAVAMAKENAILNGLHNCDFIAKDVLKVIDDIAEKPDFIVLDPPRDGIHPKALEKLGAHIRAKKMLYISCKPTSLARDLIALQEYGYRVERVCCVDMFPGTPHVETCVLLSHKNS